MWRGCGHSRRRTGRCPCQHISAEVVAVEIMAAIAVEPVELLATRKVVVSVPMAEPLVVSAAEEPKVDAGAWRVAVIGSGVAVVGAISVTVAGRIGRAVPVA